MKTIELNCKKCNGVMEVRENEDKIVCPFCGATNWIIENDEIRRDKAKYRYLKESEMAKAESAVKRDAALYKFLKFKYIFIAAAVIAAIIFLIVIINNANEHAHIVPPASASKLIGKQYEEVEKLFIDAGFVNVETVAIADLKNAFLYDANNDVGKVTSISIGGEQDFKVDEGFFIFRHTDAYDRNDQVRITYRTIPEPTRSPEDIAADAAVNADWTEKPVVLSAYETGKDQFTVAWTGKAPVYMVRVDGEERTVVADTSATFKLSNGLHTIQIVPINRETKRDDIKDITGSISIKTSVGFNLGTYNLDKNHLVAGQFSDELKINFSAEKIYDITPSSLKAVIDLHGAIHLTFSDTENSDQYLVSYKLGNEEHSIEYDTSDVTLAKWIAKEGNFVQITLDPNYLQGIGSPIIQPDKDYSFSVLLMKEPLDYVSGEKTEKAYLSSKSSNVNIKTTPVWKEAPIITLGEQTADGEVTIHWTHPAIDLGCQYIISLRKKTAFVTTGESELLRTEGSEAVIKNLQNGNYTLVVIPEYEGIKGTSSAEFTVAVNNNWSQAPEVTVTQVNSRTAKVEITHIYGIGSYNIKVSCGNTESLLRFVDLDYSLYDEYTVKAKSPVTEFVFRYEQEMKEEEEIKVKFEIYGIHNSEDENTQKSATTTVQITLKP